MSLLDIILLSIYALGFLAGMLYPIVAGDVDAAKEYSAVFAFSFFWPVLIFIGIPFVFLVEWAEKFHPLIGAAQYMNKFWKRHEPKNNG